MLREEDDSCIPHEILVPTKIVSTSTVSMEDDEPDELDDDPRLECSTLRTRPEPNQFDTTPSDHPNTHAQSPSTKIDDYFTSFKNKMDAFFVSHDSSHPSKSGPHDVDRLERYFRRFDEVYDQYQSILDAEQSRRDESEWAAPEPSNP